MTEQATRAIAIVFNILLLGAMLFLLLNRGIPADEDDVLFILLTLLAPASSLVALFSTMRRE